jgi:hypothetical protein
MYYSAAWTDSGFPLGCSHEHETIAEADFCIACAGGYVVAVENGVMRSLTAEEEAEFQRVHYAPRTEESVVHEEVVNDPRYAVMIRVRVGDRWTWTTWMCFETYAEAAAHARAGNKIVRFRSPEWAALKQQEWAAQPQQIEAAPRIRETKISRIEGETFVEFVFRILDAYGLDQHAEPISEVKHDATDPDLLGTTLSRLSGWETTELERMYAVDRHALLRALQTFFLSSINLKGGFTEWRYTRSILRLVIAGSLWQNGGVWPKCRWKRCSENCSLLK